MEVRISEIGHLEDGSLEIRSAQVGTAEIGDTETGSAEIRFSKVRTRKHGPDQIRFLQIRRNLRILLPPVIPRLNPFLGNDSDLFSITHTIP